MAEKSTKSFMICDGNDSVLPDSSLLNGFKINCTLVDNPLVDAPLHADPSLNKPVTLCPEGSEDIDFSDAVLKYINQILMEEDAESEALVQKSPLELQAAEKSFYDVLGQTCLPQPINNFPQSDENYNGTAMVLNKRGYNASSNLSDLGFNDKSCDKMSSYEQTVVEPYPQPSSQALLSLLGTNSHTSSGIVEYPLNGARDDRLDMSSVDFHFGECNREACNLEPNAFDSLLDMASSDSLYNELNSEAITVVKFVENANAQSINRWRGRLNPFIEDVDSELGRRCKQSAVYTETTLISEMFDKMLLSNREEIEPALRKSLQIEMSKYALQRGHLKGSNGAKSRRTKRVTKKVEVDLTTLLILCAQAIAAGDSTTASGILKQIRQHSGPTGDATQRLANYFADGLEARLAGYGSPRYTELLVRPRTAVDVLKSHHVFLTVCPIIKTANFFSNKTIMRVADKATKLHVIHFGISYGFQWPSLIEQLSSRPGGPPKLRITGIDFPRAGFKPSQLIDETGQRLAIYAGRFNVPFEYHAIAKKWETIRKVDIKFEEDEVLVVNCILKFRYVHDETVALESPRNTVLKLIKDLNPSVFILGVRNGAQNGPFFFNRFQEAMFYYSALFDMFETILPRETPERIAVEKELLAREIMNLVACEGSERVERPESYRQWQVRNERAGFKQLPLKKDINKIAKERVESVYHKNFLIDENRQWLVMGWKGRITHAFSSWKPTHKRNLS